MRPPGMFDGGRTSNRGMDEHARREKIRQLIAVGALRGERSTQFTIDSGHGKPCLVCGAPIEAPTLAFEFAPELRLDARCFRIWLHELTGA